ncbi:transcription factor E2-alpha, partial [Trichonephila clavipes]
MGNLYSDSWQEISCLVGVQLILLAGFSSPSERKKKKRGKGNPFGSDGFDQDSTRFNSSKPGPYSDAFFIDGPHAAPDPWSTSSSLQSSSYSYSNSVIGIPASHPPPTSSAFSTMHLPPEPM